MSGQKIIDGPQRAVEGDISRVTIQGQLWTKHTLPNMRCEDCDGGVYDEWAHCPFCGQPLIIAAQRRRITDLETALLAATDLAKRLEADRSDMEAVGYALISTLADFCDHPALKNWHPIQCPTEVVGDLLNRIEELEAWIKTIEAIDAERVQHMVQREMAATELVLRIEELEAERDARPAAIEWRPRRCAEEAQELWIGSAGLGEIRRGGDRGEWFWCGPGPMDLTKFSMFYPTPEAAKAAVEEALRGLSAKTEEA